MKNQHRMTKEQKEETFLLYSQGMTCGKIAKKFGFTRHVISRFLRKNGISIIKRTCKKYNINENYFDTIDTEDKAYFLGLMYADGNVAKNGNMCKISLQEQDVDILEKFKLYIGSNQSLYFEKPKKEHWSNTYRLCVHDKLFKSGLIKNGCIPAKSLTLKFPTEDQVPEHLLRHFIRGYFDGDGHITKKGTSCSIVSSKDFVENLHLSLNVANINSYIRDCKNPLTKRLIINKKENSLKFLEMIYSNSTVYLNRKYNRYLSIDKIRHKNQFI